jgi:hypothetical protein
MPLPDGKNRRKLQSMEVMIPTADSGEQRRPDKRGQRKPGSWIPGNPDEGGESMGLYSHDEIARVAYELYVKGGFLQGRDLEYWLEAEKIMMGMPPPAAGRRGKAESAGRTGRHSVKKPSTGSRTSARA